LGLCTNSSTLPNPPLPSPSAFFLSFLSRLVTSRGVTGVKGVNGMYGLYGVYGTPVRGVWRERFAGRRSRIVVWISVPLVLGSLAEEDEVGSVDW
jgi:hypothetical protein